jgi:hypothetical protein
MTNPNDPYYNMPTTNGTNYIQNRQVYWKERREQIDDREPEIGNTKLTTPYLTASDVNKYQPKGNLSSGGRLLGEFKDAKGTVIGTTQDTISEIIPRQTRYEAIKTQPTYRQLRDRGFVETQKADTLRPGRVTLMNKRTEVTAPYKMTTAQTPYSEVFSKRNPVMENSRHEFSYMTTHQNYRPLSDGYRNPVGVRVLDSTDATTRQPQIGSPYYGTFYERPAFMIVKDKVDDRLYTRRDPEIGTLYQNGSMLYSGNWVDQGAPRRKSDMNTYNQRGPTKQYRDSMKVRTEVGENTRIKNKPNRLLINHPQINPPQKKAYQTNWIFGKGKRQFINYDTELNQRADYTISTMNSLKDRQAAYNTLAANSAISYRS